MPILALQLKYDTSTGVRDNIVLSGSIPKQPITLTHYQIILGASDATLDTMWVKLPFFNNFDINTNYPISNAFPIYKIPTNVSHSERVEYEFNPAQNIQEAINNWNVYDEDGDPYTNQSYTINLVFNYRRAELM